MRSGSAPTATALRIASSLLNGFLSWAMAFKTFCMGRRFRRNGLVGLEDWPIHQLSLVFKASPMLVTVAAGGLVSQ